MANTPRTDSAEPYGQPYSDCAEIHVPKAFARQLERELNETRQELAMARTVFPAYDIRAYVPQTYGEAVGLGWITQDDCCSHEWDNRTSAENLVWIVERLKQSRADLAAAKVELAKERERVSELEGLTLGNEVTDNDGLWVEVFVPLSRMCGTEIEGDENPTLGKVFPDRKAQP